MKNFHFGAIVLVVMAGTCQSAYALTVPFFDDFNGIGDNTPLNTAPTGWNSVSGTVDWVQDNTYGITCLGSTGGCVDLDGSTQNAGFLLTSDTFTLTGGQTYQMTAWISGNQRNQPVGATDDVKFGFADNLNNILASTLVPGLVGTSNVFNLYSVIYTPGSDTVVKLFFNNNNVGVGDNFGAVIDNAKVTSVPLPAAAWLMLSGLAALGAVARRRTVS